MTLYLPLFENIAIKSNMEFKPTLSISIFILLFTYCGFSQAICQYQKELSWSYYPSLENGPQHWEERYPTCSGKHQSPINIVTANVVKDESLESLELENYDKPLPIYQVYNIGYGVRITQLEQDGVNRTVTIGAEKYNLSDIEFHWGDKYNKGSEHTINNIQYALEIQFIHRNMEGKQAIVAVLYESSVNNNSDFNTIVNALKTIPYMRYGLATDKPIDLSKWVTNGCTFYRYDGSRTSPECNEGVIWSICENPGKIGFKQLDEFRKLYNFYNRSRADLRDCKLVNNYRPVQPLNDRTVKLSK